MVNVNPSLLCSRLSANHQPCQLDLPPYRRLLDIDPDRPKISNFDSPTDLKPAKRLVKLMLDDDSTTPKKRLNQPSQANLEIQQSSVAAYIFNSGKASTGDHLEKTASMMAVYRRLPVTEQKEVAAVFYRLLLASRRRFLSNMTFSQLC